MLEGTLESFTLPDIFQLLAFTKKTGCLRLSRDGDRGRVYLRDGQVYYAVAAGGRLALGRRLVGAGLVSIDQLERALDDQHRGRGLRLGRILVDDGVIDEDTLASFLREQIFDAVFHLMRWPDGGFTFDSDGDGAALPPPLDLMLTVEDLIVECQRRLEEWEAVAARIPSMEATVAMSATPGERSTDVTIRPEEWRLLTLIDGRRTVGELIDGSGQGDFQTGRTLHGMLSSGLIELRDPSADAPASVTDQLDLLHRLEGEDDATPIEVPRAAADAPTGAETTRASSTTARTDDEPAEEPAGARGAARPAAEPSAQRLTTDPSIDEDLVRRLIDGVKGL